jgi:hypothetical protein
MVEERCNLCGKMFLATRRGTRCCQNCGIKARTKEGKEIMRKAGKTRPLTGDTEYLICIYTYRGDSAASIADVLDRGLEQVKNIIQKAKESGRYDRHIRRYKEFLINGAEIKSTYSTRESFRGY